MPDTASDAAAATTVDATAAPAEGDAASAPASNGYTVYDLAEAAVPRESKPPSNFKRWLLEGFLRSHEAAHAKEGAHKPHSWWQVVCLTGVDYFSTLGYQPGIAALAAGALSPLATLVLVLLTLFGALPIYSRVAHESPHGEGSIAMLESLLQWWQGKLFVLALLGFVATDFIITITLSAADATAHVIENPFLKPFLEHGFWQIGITLGLIALLAAVFLKGFKEAIGIAVALTVIYLGLNAVVVGVGIQHVFAHPELISGWQHRLTEPKFGGGNPMMAFGLSLLLFPRLALGLSGFETGVAVMPLVKGEPGDTEANPAGRIKNTRRLLAAAALIMSVYLLASSMVTTILIPPQAFEKGGPANGRALAYLAHTSLGEAFGTVYDISTILILWFAGASAMAGLLNIVPRYLPRYGMAPEWVRATRPLVLIFAGIAFAVTLIFKADVEAQGGAYATGVLVLMTSAATAVCIAIARAKESRLKLYAFIGIALVFAYTTGANVIERPDGVRIASFFIAAIVAVSLGSRVYRTTELRVSHLELDDAAIAMIREAVAHDPVLRVIPNHPDTRDEYEYRTEAAQIRIDHQMPEDAPLLFFEVYIKDPSAFSDRMQVCGVDVGGYKVLRAEAVAIPNAIAAFLLYLRDTTDKRPHCYFNWGESNPVQYLVKYLLSGQGDVAPVTREILRRVEKDLDKRPAIHVAV